MDGIMEGNKYQAAFEVGNINSKEKAFHQIENMIKYDLASDKSKWRNISVPDRNLYAVSEKHGLIRIWFKDGKFKRPPLMI